MSIQSPELTRGRGCCCLHALGFSCLRRFCIGLVFLTSMRTCDSTHYLQNLAGQTRSDFQDCFLDVDCLAKELGITQ
jgi:hypothetical protein